MANLPSPEDQRSARRRDRCRRSLVHQVIVPIALTVHPQRLSERLHIGTKQSYDRKSTTGRNGSAAPARGLQMQPFSRVPEPVGRRDPRTTAIPCRGFSGLIRERPFPEWTGRSTRNVPPTAWGRSRPLEARRRPAALRPGADRRRSTSSLPKVAATYRQGPRGRQWPGTREVPDATIHLPVDSDRRPERQCAPCRP